jgi:hypothetical protein
VSLFAQVHGGAYQHRNGKEFTLPVLERLEPEPAGGKVAQDRHARLPVALLFLAVLFAAANRVERDGGKEQQQEHDG